MEFRTNLFGKTLKVFEIEIIDGLDDLIVDTLKLQPNNTLDINDFKSGTVVNADAKHGLIVTAKDNRAFIRLKQIQLEGSNRMSDIEFLRGRKIDIGTVLG